MSKIQENLDKMDAVISPAHNIRNEFDQNEHSILIRKMDQNATFASVLKLMKNKVDKEQVAENVIKIRQTKTGDVLVQLQRGSNATHLKEAVTTAIGSEANIDK